MKEDMFSVSVAFLTGVLLKKGVLKNVSKFTKILKIARYS